MIVERIKAAACRPVDIASLAAFRIIFGIVMFLGIVRFISSGQVPKLYTEPRFFFTYPGFDWVTPWSLWGMYIHYIVLGLLALLIAAGVWHRVAAGLFAIGFAYTQLIDVTNYLNHHYLVVLIAVQLALVDTSLRRQYVPAWMLWLFRFQIGVVYVSAGLAKAKSDWLVHGQPLNLWLAARTDTPIVGGLFDQPSVALAMSWLGFLFDTTIVIWLSWARTRLPAYIVLIVFHGLTGYLFMIGMFPIIMTTAALIFFSPSWPRRLLGKPLPAQLEAPLPLPSRAALIAITLHVVLQIALPLRHHVYPGAVLWNEDGMRFAWHVMIREKHGAVTFVVELDGKRAEVPASAYLNWRQEREMGSQPDLILQLAHRIGRDLQAKGHRDVKVFAETNVSLNGRARHAMIDPTIDLMTVRDVGPRDWVLPAPAESPRPVQPLR